MKKTYPVVILNGASSAGKTSLAKALQSVAPYPFLRLSVDDFLNMLPERHAARSVREAAGIPYTALVQGFHKAIASMVATGNCVIVDHVAGDRRAWLSDCLEALGDLPLMFVAVYCDLDQLLKREERRTDRLPSPALARAQHQTIHQLMVYDLEVDTTMLSPEACARQILDYLDSGTVPTAANALRSKLLLSDSKLLLSD
jgi:chloramphenicol 3-O-phosphotransferase